MKYLKYAAVCAVSLMSVLPASADTINLAFQGLNQSKIIFENGDNGRTMTCTMTGSGAGSVPTGCNWSIGVPIASMEGQASLKTGNGVCKISCTSE